MSKSKPARSIDDLAKSVEEITGRVQVLVAAVDDLRMEVEAWAQDASVVATWRMAESASLAKLTATVPTDGSCGNSSSASEALADLERLLMARPARRWPCDEELFDAPEFPLGETLSLELSIWEAVLDQRPAHIVGGGCDCEEDMGAPFLFAWSDKQRAYLLELDDALARELQRLCLAAQREMTLANHREPIVTQTQRDLW